VHRYLKSRITNIKRVGATAAVYASAILEYLVRVRRVAARARRRTARAHAAIGRPRSAPKCSSLPATPRSI
jgi:hypothetical protein